MSSDGSEQPDLSTACANLEELLPRPPTARTARPPLTLSATHIPPRRPIPNSQQHSRPTRRSTAENISGEYLHIRFSIFMSMQWGVMRILRLSLRWRRWKRQRNRILREVSVEQGICGWPLWEGPLLRNIRDRGRLLVNPYSALPQPILPPITLTVQAKRLPTLTSSSLLVRCWRTWEWCHI